LLASLNAWLPTVRRLRPAQPWEQVVLAVNQALPPGRRCFTRDRLVRAVRLLVAEGLAEPGLLAPARVGDARPRRRPETARAVEMVARCLRGHRREAAERGVAPQEPADAGAGGAPPRRGRPDQPARRGQGLGAQLGQGAGRLRTGAATLTALAQSTTASFRHRRPGAGHSHPSVGS
jgi:hypothetical protein